MCPDDPGFLSFGGLVGISGDRLVATIEFEALSSGSTPIGFEVVAPFSDATGMPLQVPEPSFGALAAFATIGLLRRLRRSWRPDFGHAPGVYSIATPNPLQAR